MQPGEGPEMENHTNQSAGTRGSLKEEASVLDISGRGWKTITGGVLGVVSVAFSSAGIPILDDGTNGLISDWLQTAATTVGGVGILHKVDAFTKRYKPLAAIALRIGSKFL